MRDTDRAGVGTALPTCGSEARGSRSGQCGKPTRQERPPPLLSTSPALRSRLVKGGGSLT